MRSCHIANFSHSDLCGDLNAWGCDSPRRVWWLQQISGTSSEVSAQNCVAPRPPVRDLRLKAKKDYSPWGLAVDGQVVTKWLGGSNKKNLPSHTQFMGNHALTDINNMLPPSAAHVGGVGVESHMPGIPCSCFQPRWGRRTVSQPCLQHGEPCCCGSALGFQFRHGEPRSFLTEVCWRR